MKKFVRKSFVFLAALAALISAVFTALPSMPAEAADTSYGIPSELKGIWQYVGQSCAADAATTWMRGNAYKKTKPYFNGALDTSSSEYKARYEKLQKDEYLKNTRICILYLPLCPYSKSYLPVFQDMAYECNAQVLAVDLTAYLTASLMPYYSVSTYGATSPIVLYIDKNGDPQGYSGVHSAALFADILKDAGYESNYVEKDSERYTAEQEYKNTILSETNRQRIREGLLPLSTFESLQDAADLRAKEVNVLTSHTRPDGTLFTTALTGILAPSVWGENLCAGPIVSTPTAAMTGWMNSPGHRANILSKSYSHIGVGYYCNTTDTSRYKDNWVQVFAGTCGVTSISVDTPQIIVTQGVPISDMDITVTLTCPVHGETTMPLIDEMCTGYDKNASGEQKVTVHYGNLTTDFIVSSGEFDPIAITEDMVTLPKDTVVYTGQMLTPKVSVVNISGEYTLLENYSYTVEYSNNINAGTGSVTVTGKGNYTGSVTKTFTIRPKDLATASIVGIKEAYEYTSRPLKPAVTVYSDRAMLYEGSDYSVSYADNVGEVVAGKPGSPDTVDTTATITVTGMGNYAGTVSTQFKITGDEIFQKATQLAKRVWPNRDEQYGKNAYEFWQYMSKESNFDMARNEVEASIKAAKDGGYYEQVMACTTYPEAARIINDYHRFCFEYKHGDAQINSQKDVTAAAIDESFVSISGIESSVGIGSDSSSGSVLLQISDTQLPASISPAEYDIFSAVPLEIDLKINEESAQLSSPVTITMKIPERLGDGSSLVVLHYKNGAENAPEVLNVVLNGDGTFSFTTSSFSPFVLANKIETYDAVQTDPSDNTFGESKDSAPAPSGVQAVHSDIGEITVSWDAVSTTENWTVTGYEVSWSVHENMSDAATVKVGANETSCVLQNLAQGTYYVTVSTEASSAWTSYAASRSHIAKAVITQQAETEAPPETDTPPETEAPPETEPETTPETQPQTQPQTQPETQPQTQPETQPQTQQETTPEVIYTESTVKDNSTNIILGGKLTEQASVTVTKLDECPAEITNQLSGYDASIIQMIDIHLPSADYEGKVTVSIPVGLENNSKPAIVFHQTSAGKVEVLETVITNGFAVVEVSEFSPFIVTIKNAALAETEESKAPETKAPESNTDETSAPETKIPETNAPETKVPESNSGETNAPETKTPETKAPEAATATPETKANEAADTKIQTPDSQNASAAKTGTDFRPGILIGIITLSVIVIFVTVYLIKRRRA